MLHVTRRSAIKCLREALNSPGHITVCERRALSQVFNTVGEPGLSRPRRQHSDNRRRLPSDGSRYVPGPGDTIDQLNYHLSRAARAMNFGETFDIMSAIQKRGIQPTLETYHSILFVLAQNELAEEALAILADMQSSGIRPDVLAFNLILQAAMPNPQVHAHTRDLMKAAYVSPNSRSYELILGQWVEQKNLEMCLQDLQTMFDTGVAPTMTIMTDIVGLAADIGRPRLALDLINAYEAGEVERLPVSVWIRVLISSVEEHYDAGIELALQKCEKVTLDEGLLMDIVHFATRRGNLPLVQKILEDLKLKGAKLKEYHYAPLIELHAAEKNFPDVLTVFETMHQNGIAPTYGSTMAFSSALSKDWDNVDSTYHLIEAMRDRGEKVDLVVLNAFIRAARIKEDLHRAVGFYHAFPSFGISPDPRTLDLLLANCASHENDTLANELWDELVKGGVQPNEQAYRSMIHLTLRSMTDYEACFHWLEEMKSKGITPSKALYDTLARRLAYRRDSRADMVLQEMQEQGYQVSGALRRYVEHSGRFDKTPPRKEASLRQTTDRMIHDKRRMFAVEEEEACEAQKELHEEAKSTVA
ncbi:hypothetical protein FRB93_001265 [Tulasnella sp. JGI-2019a]|nr:hypothetical protein FRB93_001265 [Tulasnella sp. JGI-2019a]